MHDLVVSPAMGVSTWSQVWCGRENSSAVNGGNRCESTGVCRRGFVSRILTHSNVGGDGDRDEPSDSVNDSDDDDGNEEGDRNGESAAPDERKMARSIFRSIHDRSLSRPTSDTAYSVLTDALPIGPRRCKKLRRQGLCDLCGLLNGVRAIETTRHLALECPYTTLTLEAVLRAVLESTTLDEAVLEEVRGMGREQLVHEYRRLCITGFRLTTGRGQMAEGRIGATPTRVIMLETLAGIVRRRHRRVLPGCQPFVLGVRLLLSLIHI